MQFPMTPRDQSTVSLAATSTTGNVALGGSATTTLGALQSTQIIVTSPATTNGLSGGTAASIAYIRFGTSSAIAATAPNGATPGSIPILPGSIQTFTVPAGYYTHVAAITPATGAATLFFTQGYGN